MVHFNASNETSILFAASLIWPMVDSYYVTLLLTLSMIKNKGIESNLINKKVQWLAESLYEDKAIAYFESCN